MKRLRSLIRWTIGIVIGAYLLIALALSIPAFQRFVAQTTAEALSDLLGAPVGIERIQLGLNARVIADDVTLSDLQGEPMLEVSRVGARINLWQLMAGRIRLGNVQLFGLRAELYQNTPEEKPNFWFVVEALQSNDTTSNTPLDLRIGQALVRRTSIRWEQRWKEETKGRLNTGKLWLDNLNLTAQLNALREDTLNLELKRLDVNELQSGLSIKELTLNLEAGAHGINLSDLHLALAGSDVSVSLLRCRLSQGRAFPDSLALQAKGRIDSRDVEPLLSAFFRPTDAIDFEIYARGRRESITIDSLRLSDDLLAAQLSLSATLGNAGADWKQSTIEANIEEASLDVSPLAGLTGVAFLAGKGRVSLTGDVGLAPEGLTAKAMLTTSFGNANLSGRLAKDGEIDAFVEADGFNVGALTRNSRLGRATMNVEAQGTIDKGMRVKGAVPSFDFGGYTYRNVALDATIYPQDGRYEGGVEIADANVTLSCEGRADLPRHTYALNASVADFAPNALGLTERFADTRFAADIALDVRGNPLDSIDGTAYLDGFTMTQGDSVYRPGDIHITATHETGGTQAFGLVSPFLEANVQGAFTLRRLPGDIASLLSSHIPTLNSSASPLPHPNDGTADGNSTEGQAHAEGEYCSFTAKLYDTRPLRNILGIDIGIDKPVLIEGSADTEGEIIGITASAPHLAYQNEDIKDLQLRIEGYEQSILASLRLKRLMKGAYIDLGFDMSGTDNTLSAKLFWDNNRQPALRGDVSLTTRFTQDALGQYRADGQIEPSQLTVGDMQWHVYPGTFAYCNEALTIDNFSIGGGSGSDEPSQAEHLLAVDGTVSRLEGDTLRATLRGIDLESIFSLINFHAVDLAGEATGSVTATSLMTKPYVDARFTVPDFSLNNARMGHLDLHGNWGQRDYSIYLDGRITSDDGTKHSRVSGYVTPKTDVPYHGIDLNIEADSLSIGFLNKYTQAIFDDMRGAASGSAHLFGPFKGLNIEGGLLVHQGNLGVPIIGVRYSVEQDSVLLSPGTISFAGATLNDPHGRPGKTTHKATINGTLRHANFSNLTYDISIDGDELLAYNLPDFGDMPFCGMVTATGNITMKGSPGNVSIAIKAQPQRGSWLTYDFTSPDNVPENLFVNYVDRRAPQGNAPGDNDAQEQQPAPDIRINFDLDLNANTTMRLLMDARSGDMIALQGSGHIIARYYNKADMQIFGTYRVEKGTYNLSLQEIIHKDFAFTDGGTITFAGEPMDATLQLQATHTVSGVSLNDLSARSTFSNTSARVNCLMNITGKASQPNLTFDLDILNVNEDEKQMVRSLISTEEERNMQVIYLLGIGRFYTYDYTNDTQSQSSTAMNSLLSSTLSGQLNQMLANMIGNSKWSVGTNLNTGNTGWSDLDVEGMLQGSLLNDRLLINGNFGYRDNPVNSSNFIGDFDMQYRLTKPGTVSLKAYNKTNDRYFTKTSLTTQGVGIMLKKDFQSLRELFRRHAKGKE